MDRPLVQLSTPSPPTPIIQIKITGKYATKPHATAIAQHGDPTARQVAVQPPSRAHPSPLHFSLHPGHVLLLSNTLTARPQSTWNWVHAALTVPAGQMMPIRTSGSSESNTPLHQS